MSSHVPRYVFPVSPSAPFAVLLLLASASCGGSGGGGTSPPPAGTQEIGAAITNLNQETSEGLVASCSALQDVLDNPAMVANHDIARFLLAGTTAGVFLDDNQPSPPPFAPKGSPGESKLAQLLIDMGISMPGASIFSHFDTDGDLIPGVLMSSNFPHLGRFQSFLSDDILMQVRISADFLEAVVPSWSTIRNDLPGSIETIELDYGDCQLIASALRATEALLLIQHVIDLDLDLFKVDQDVIAWEMNPSEVPYRLYSGDSPPNIIADVGHLSDSGREGLLNEPALLSTSNTLDTALGAQDRLTKIRFALAACVANFRRGMEYVEDANSADDLIYVEDKSEYLAATPWLNELELALGLNGGFVSALVVADGFGVIVDLPGFQITPNLFAEATYAGRLMLPDYTGAPTVADENSFGGMLASNVPGVYNALTGLTLTGADVLDMWHALNVQWDTALMGMAPEELAGY
jgi:hypothetical protein